MLSKLIQEKVEGRYGKPIRYAKDCEMLALSIQAFTGEKISCSTVKRLFGLIESDNEPRLYTLDIVAQFLGYLNYDHLLQEFNPNKNDLSQSIETIASKDLKKGDTIRLKYAPNRYLAVSYIEEGVFRIVESNDPKIQQNELLTFNNVGRNLPLFASWRSITNGNAKSIVLAKISGITSIEKI